MFCLKSFIKHSFFKPRVKRIHLVIYDSAKLFDVNIFKFYTINVISRINFLKCIYNRIFRKSFIVIFKLNTIILYFISFIPPIITTNLAPMWPMFNFLCLLKTKTCCFANKEETIYNCK